jgi:hypothetical protein
MFVCCRVGVARLKRIDFMTLDGLRRVPRRELRWKTSTSLNELPDGRDASSTISFG